MSEGPERGDGRRPDGAAFAIAFVLAVAATVIALSTRAMPDAAGYTAIGPKIFPYIVAGGLLLLAIWTAAEAWRGDFPSRQAQDLPPIFWLVAALAVQLLLVKTAGFAIATGLMFALAAKAFGRGQFAFTIPVGIAFSFVVWFVFALGLQLTLPEGPVETFVRSMVRGA